MKFFKKWWLVKLENQNNHKISDNLCDYKNLKNEYHWQHNSIINSNKNGKYRDLKNKADSLQRQLERTVHCNGLDKRQIVTPDEFFTAPDDVEIYQEEKMMSSWIFVDSDSFYEENLDEKSKDDKNPKKSLMLIKGKPIFTTYDEEAFQKTLMGPLLQPIFITSNKVSQLFKNRSSLSIQQAFGLSDDGSLLINLDHILIYKGSESINYEFKFFSSYEKGVEITDKYRERKCFYLVKKFFEWIKRLIGIYLYILTFACHLKFI